MSLYPKRWQIAPPAPPSHVARFSDLHPVVVQVLYNRGITNLSEARAFLNGDGVEGNPFDLANMPAAVTRLRQALRAGEPIAVYGDFDADGVTATALLVQTLRGLGGHVHPYIPHRVDEGYGLHTDVLTTLAQHGIRVVVTVDCGVRSLHEIDHANRLGLDVIVTDHHSVGPELPAATAVIDPKRRDSEYFFRELSGVGVAFKLAQGLLRSHRQTPVTTREVRLEEKDLLDLVALGTVADLVPLVSENRTLVHQGLAQINRRERPGIDALCHQSGLKNGAIDTRTIGYVLGPRLNAAGRVAHAKLAYQLLETRYPAEAERLAIELDQLNQERRQLTRQIQERARHMALADGDTPHLLFAADPDFSAGIVGLVASRLVDEFYRPAIVVEVGPEVSRGSARSIPEFHITQALDECAALLTQYGGHAAAAGFTVHNQHLDQLIDRLRALASQQLTDREPELVPTLSIDAEIPLSEMSGDLYQAMTQLEPCGYANPHPLFLSRNVQVQHQRAVGNDNRHLKVTLFDGHVSWDGIAFRQGEWAGKLPNRVDIVYHLEINDWNNTSQLQLNIQSIQPTGWDDAATYPELNPGGL